VAGSKNAILHLLIYELIPKSRLFWGGHQTTHPPSGSTIDLQFANNSVNLLKKQVIYRQLESADAIPITEALKTHFDFLKPLTIAPKYKTLSKETRPFVNKSF
jgi:hypothetical protein